MNQFKYYLRCWHCKASLVVYTSELPQDPLTVADDADLHGWLSVVDMPHTRVLVFCSKECKEEVKLKDGSYPEFVWRAAA
jgi:hypothetical protein